MFNYANNISYPIDRLNENNNARNLGKRKIKLSAEDCMLKCQRGMFAGMDAKKLGVEACVDVIIKETLSGNFDYLKGFNQAIGKDIAKRAYSLIKKGKIRG